MRDNIPDALIAAFERQYDSSWNDPQLRNERLAMRYGWAAAMEAKQCLLQIQEPAPVQAAPAAVAVQLDANGIAQCPLCGSESKHVQAGVGGHRILCWNDDCECSSGYFCSKEEAITSWNARAALAATPAAAPAVLPDPDAAIKEVMALVSDVVQEATHEGGDKAEKALRMRLRALLATGGQAKAVPDGWREQFATEVYADLAAADNQDVPLEEYPDRILKVLDSTVGPRHPVVIKWRNDAIRNCIAIAYKYCRDPESHKYLKQDLEAMLTTEPAPQAQAVERGEVLVTVSGFTGSGKSAIAGEIEIMCRALGLQVEWPDSDSEKHMTHADWIAALEQYKPHVRIVECNVPHSVVKGQDK